MIKIEKKTFILLGTAVVLATSILVALGFLLYCRVGGYSLIPEKEYAQMKQVADRYAKLYSMQEKINREGLEKVSESKEMNAVYKGLVNSLDDPYSEYYTPKEAKAFDDYVNASFYGIGVVFKKTEDGRMMILRVLKDSPAEVAGLKKGDEIVAVDEKKYDTAEGVRKAVRGKSGTTVKITYARKGEEKTLDVTRGIMHDATCEGLLLKGKIGYIRINTFGEKTSSEFQEALEDLKKERPKGLIIDLRANTGGYVDQAVKVADQLLPTCVVAYMEDRNGKRTVFRSAAGKVDLPLVLMVDGHTASASELLAAAVKDNGRGKLVGVTTYGKGVVQSEYKFKDGSALKLTVAQYFSPKGRQINKKGIKPDYKVVLPEDAEEDTQLKKAMSLIDGDS